MSKNVTDPISPWFNICEELGEYIGIRFGRIAPGTSDPEWFFVRHTDFDGIGGMAELLRSLPRNHPNRSRILERYRTMWASLLKYQDENGMWRQLVDRPESWPETSCTGMFTFAMITGVKQGWLDSRAYAPAARKAWLALIKYLNADAEISDVCEGTNKKNDYQYYLDRPRKVGDLHGQAAVLWSAAAFLRHAA